MQHFGGKIEQASSLKHWVGTSREALNYLICEYGA